MVIIFFLCGKVPNDPGVGDHWFTWQEGIGGGGGYLEQTLNKQARVVLEGGVGPAQAWALSLGGSEKEAECSDDLRKQEVEIKPSCYDLILTHWSDQTSAGLPLQKW